MEENMIAQSDIEEAERLKRLHVWSIQRGRDLPEHREGWALQDPVCMVIAPRLSYCRGDGWWTIEQACLYPTKEMAEAMANKHSGRKPHVVFVSQ
ncbi:MAG: hypothetical protein E6R03_17800 [Hyphomicrobiaceae bacterium]|nr:MAG: hypothetical protein E6R03_17800 [Hyphomicrobiaceae bacterium]